MRGTCEVVDLMHFTTVEYNVLPADGNAEQSSLRFASMMMCQHQLAANRRSKGVADRQAIRRYVGAKALASASDQSPRRLSDPEMPELSYHMSKS